jgi:hypothetical protein
MRYIALPRNGRYYHAWQADKKYPFPCDRIARDNYDIVNGTIYHYCHGTGGFDDSPLGDVVFVPLVGGHLRLKKIADLGCGSGTWVAHVASSLPDAIVVGVDLVEGQDMLVHARKIPSRLARVLTTDGLRYRQIPNAIWRVPNSLQGSALDLDGDLSSLGLGSFGKFQSRSTLLHGDVC